MFDGVRLAFGFLALTIAGSAEAQGDLDQGKSAAQLFASACATCHKSPQSVSKTKWFFGLESFLREHYTSSSESATILATYHVGKRRAVVADRLGEGATTVGRTHGIVDEYPIGREQVDPAL
jgi:cytochrome c553